MYAIVRYFMEDLDKEPQMEIVNVALCDPDAEEMLACQVEEDFDGVDGLYDKVHRLWEWDMDDEDGDKEFWSKLEEHYYLYHIKICEL